MEIITYIVTGTLEHPDSSGAHSIVQSNQVQIHDKQAEVLVFDLQGIEP